MTDVGRSRIVGGECRSAHTFHFHVFEIASVHTARNAMASPAPSFDILLAAVYGSIELAGSAVAAVRQWKYKPYLLLGQPVTVDTQIQVNYQLRP